MCVSTNFKITTEPLFSNTGAMVQSEFRRKVFKQERRSRYLVPGICWSNVIIASNTVQTHIYIWFNYINIVISRLLQPFYCFTCHHNINNWIFRTTNNPVSATVVKASVSVIWNVLSIEAPDGSSIAQWLRRVSQWYETCCPWGPLMAQWLGECLNYTKCTKWGPGSSVVKASVSVI